ncbi:GNAT family N-acetyltransferase [Vibrio profundi]|uniref:GNAT family N-acetyltransferase n=1 Tax=Vibrio profundi TaxID=1774960 RepID=UPI0037359DD1
MSFQLEPILDSEFELRFQALKQGLFEHVDAVFGWDDEFQKERLIQEYQADWFYWITRDQTRVGLVCFKPYDNAYHVHLLLVFPEYRSQGVGHQVMKELHQQAVQESRDRVTLSSFIRNRKAIQFYQSLGYTIVNQEDEFVSMSLTLP